MPRMAKKHPQMGKTAGPLLAIQEEGSQTNGVACYHLGVMAFSIQMIQL